MPSSAKPEAARQSPVIQLPEWARVSAPRLAHIERVTALLAKWADEMHLQPDERKSWLDAGRMHDVLRDATPVDLEGILGEETARIPFPCQHGHAAALMLLRNGETRSDVLEGVRWHTVGHSDWGRTGKALFMADYLEPGRPAEREARARLARRVPADFERVLVEVTRDRLIYGLRRELRIFPATVAMWNSLV